MSENKEKNNTPTDIVSEDNVKTLAEGTEPEPAPMADSDDDIATPEEVAAEERRAAERKAKTKVKDKDDEAERFAEFQHPEDLVNPYLECDPQIPWPKFEESPFLSRGCHKAPAPYTPVSKEEVRSCAKMTSTDWLEGVRQPTTPHFDVVEVRFKNNRKDYFRLPEGLEVVEGDLVAVEVQKGFDIGIVSLCGELCRLQMVHRRVSADSENIKKVYRRANAIDIDKWVEGLREERIALARTREIASEQGLQMKLDDVEFQGDHTKAIFYYTADDRVDFRTLIKTLADEFRVRVEMKQIGVRQEAGRLGGLGTCGRELCCCTWLSNFKSVTTSAAKVQQIHPNPQKLAGQCGKLKCCLNFEYEVYADALKQFPPQNTPLRFQKGLALHKKTDVLRGIMWYAYENDSELYAIKAENVKAIIQQNREQQYPERLEDFKEELMSTAGLQQESSNSDFENELRRLAEDAPAPMSSTAVGSRSLRGPKGRQQLVEKVTAQQESQAREREREQQERRAQQQQRKAKKNNAKPSKQGEPRQQNSDAQGNPQNQNSKRQGQQNQQQQNQGNRGQQGQGQQNSQQQNQGNRNPQGQDQQRKGGKHHKKRPANQDGANGGERPQRDNAQNNTSDKK